MKATYHMILHLYPSHTARCDSWFADNMKKLKHIDQAKKSAGSFIGENAAKAMIDWRQGDKSDQKEVVFGVDYFPEQGPGLWSPDPAVDNKVALGMMPLAQPYHLW